MKKDLYVHMPIDPKATSTTFDFTSVSIADARRELVGQPTRAPRDWTTRRRPSDPDEALRDATIAWMARLPTDVRPDRMAARYARIANKICGLRCDRLACSNYLAGLLIVDRSHRQGFPVEVLREIANLSVYFSTTYPVERAWKTTA
jgi:hypothetical protein